MNRTALLTVMLGVSAVLATGSCDPVHDSAIDALGPEAAGIPKGPTHRAGQPCVTCHDGALSDPPQFTVAGTIYQTNTTLAPATGAIVTLTDANGKTFPATANQVGNFYVQPKEFTPAYPMLVQVSFDKINVKMTSHVGRDGSCADCHFDPAGPTSAGHIYIPPNGVTP